MAQDTFFYERMKELFAKLTLKTNRTDTAGRKSKPFRKHLKDLTFITRVSDYKKKGGCMFMCTPIYTIRGPIHMQPSSRLPSKG